MTPPPAPTQASAAPGLSIRGLRKLILAALILGVVTFTSGVFVLVNQIFANFGPAVQADLEWKALRGARELAQASELGLAANDTPMILGAFGDYVRSDDVLAIVAYDGAGKSLVTHGTLPQPPNALIAGLAPGQLRRTATYFVGLANAEIEGALIGRIALVISTKRLIEAQRLLQQVRLAIGGGALAALVGGIVFIMFFTGAIIKRDAQLAEHAATLERKVDERTAELDERNQGMRLVLDNVGQGFVTIDLAGVMAPERSAIVAQWLGPASEGQSFQGYITSHDANAAAWFELGLDQLRQDVLPLDLLLRQLPRRMQAGDRTLRIDYTPIMRQQQLDRVLIVMTDITADLLRERIERESRETLALLQTVANDRLGLREFLREGERLVSEICSGRCAGYLAEKRAVHTLKGNAGLLRFDQLVQVCHDIETRMIETDERVSAEQARALEAAWQMLAGHARTLLGESSAVMLVERSDVQHLEDLIDRGAPRATLVQAIGSWQLEAVASRFERFAKQAEQLANRLGKPPVVVTVEADGVRLAPEQWGDFWSAFAHVVRNAVDHGIEEPQDRTRQGKPVAGRVWLGATLERDQVVIRVRDDGRGLDWSRLGAKAKEKGLPHATHADLEAAIFADGVSTSEEITEVSGRGVGLAAVKAVVEAMHGSIRVESQPGHGTTFEFRFDRQAAPQAIARGT